MRVALVQWNPTVGDTAGNADRAIQRVREAASRRADLVVFPELALSGYPPKDLLFYDAFLRSVADAARRVARAATDVSVLIGAPWPLDDGAGARVGNSVLLLEDGEVRARYDKRLLPTYDVFDERRYFAAGREPGVFEIAGRRVGVAVCEDLWRGVDVDLAARYADLPDPADDLARAGVDMIVSPSASPFALGKGARQRDILAGHARRLGVPVLSINQSGANDELIFDGGAHAFVPAGGGEPVLVASGDIFSEGVVLADLDAPTPPAGAADQRVAFEPERLLWEALVVGLRDYARKTGFERAVLGISGGIDSALTAAVAARALGGDNVLGVKMPSRYSSAGSRTDADDLARRLGVRLTEIPIEPAHKAAETTLDPPFDRLCAALNAPRQPGVAEENVQSRLRGLIVMALSNKLGMLPLATGNKSELAVGYCTLYGDMNGGLAVLSDMAKTQVYAVCRWLNAHPSEAGFDEPPIPEAIIVKPPSAELKPDQTDQDALPPYDLLDRILEGFIEQRLDPTRIAERTGAPRETVDRVCAMVDKAEYKRRQMAIGLKLTSLAFGTGRRMPVAQRWSRA